MAPERRRRLKSVRVLSTLLVGAALPCCYHHFCFAGSTMGSAVIRRRAQVGKGMRAAPAPPQPELPPFKQFPDDYNPDPLDKFIEILMNLDPQTNQLLEGVFFALLLGLTLISGKETYEKWQIDKKRGG
mmetsp:Transcript_39698/g.91765  ORF Transcript_39698/g.91765 Transcript_39698/m.91765 type:complete len:129 (-) Transcript_39698:440-826(-)